MERIKYYIKPAWGRDNMYLEDKKLHEALCSITGKRTLLREHKEALEKLGLQFQRIVLPENDK